MKLVINERLKHRLVGLAVILSIGAIFAPAIMKKSDKRFEKTINISIALPSKPTQPQVVMPGKQAMFKAVKVARVEIPDVPELQSDLKIAQAESLTQRNEAKLKTASVIPVIAKVGFQNNRETTANTAGVTKKNEKNIASKPKLTANKVKNGYVVQLATFSQQNNAQSLLSKLRERGYKASYNKITTQSGVVYKVFVGEANEKQQAERLQKQLANVMQIKGFLVTTKVS